MMRKTTLSMIALALFALSATACGTTPEPEPTLDPVVVEPPVVAPPPAAPTAETFPVPADFEAEAATTITAATLETELTALEADDTTDDTAAAQ